MNKKLLALFGLKWNPFSPDVPTDALLIAPRVESFCWRVENLAREGGFALGKIAARGNGTTGLGGLRRDICHVDETSALEGFDFD